MSSDVADLIEMGFTKEYAERALDETKHQGLQIALEWIIDHPPESKDASKIAVCKGLGDLDNPKTTETSSSVLQSYKCEDCGKSLKSADDIQMHSARTGHAKYLESTEEIKPLTEEEKRAQIMKLREHMQAKKLQREELDRQRNLEDEKRRRQQGKTLISAKAKFQEDEIRRNAEQMKQERAQDRAYLEKLRAEMAREKEEKLARQRGGTEDRVVSPEKPTSSTIVKMPSGSTAPAATACRLKISLPTGPPLVHTFSPSDTLAAVVLYVSQNWPGGAQCHAHEFTLHSSFPSKVFSEDELARTLESLGLCPSAVLMAKRRKLQ